MLLLTRSLCQSMKTFVQRELLSALSSEHLPSRQGLLHHLIVPVDEESGDATKLLTIEKQIANNRSQA